jgi:hypothetical protein
MHPVEADTARLDAMSGNALRKEIGRIAREVIALQVAPSRTFGRLVSRLFRVDGSEDSKRDVARRLLAPPWDKLSAANPMAFDGIRFARPIPRACRIMTESARMVWSLL